MKVHFDQATGTREQKKESPFGGFGITNCYLRQLYIDDDVNRVTPKSHHHNAFEFHLVESGFQEYDCDGKVYSISSGEFLFVPPFVTHKLLSSTAKTSKFSISFNCNSLTYLDKCVTGSLPSRIFENIQFIVNENLNKTTNSRKLVENSVFESTVALLRLVGLREETLSEEPKKTAHDFRVETAKVYIKENIERRITVKEIAEACFISSKQLTRLFIKHEGKTPAQYIINQRVEHIQNLLANENISLKTISERMNFQNEYYFNSFVKKYLGLPPGTYRKMVK